MADQPREQRLGIQIDSQRGLVEQPERWASRQHPRKGQAALGGQRKPPGARVALIAQPN